MPKESSGKSKITENGAPDHIAHFLLLPSPATLIMLRAVVASVLSSLALAHDGPMLDFDTVQVGAGRWRCMLTHLAPSLDEALTTNYTGLGWSSELVQPLLRNMSACRVLVLDDSETAMRAAWLPPLVSGLVAHCGSPEAAPLTDLDLDGSVLLDSGAAALAPALSQCTALSAVHALGNRLGDPGARAIAEALAEHPSLRLCDLGGNSIGDAGASELSRLLRQPSLSVTSPLVDLRLHDNRIGPLGVQTLADAMRENVGLERLLLDGNPIGDDGLAQLTTALTTARRPGRDSALRRLGLRATNVSDVGVGKLLSALRYSPNAPPLEALTLDGNLAVSESMLADVSALLASRHSEAPSPPGGRTTGLYAVAPLGPAELHHAARLRRT